MSKNEKIFSRNLDPDQARAFLEKDTTFVLDVRTPLEFQGGALPKAYLIPISELSSRLNELPKDKSTPILIYCAHGVRSLHGQNILIQNGYSEVFNLTQGLAHGFSHGRK
jgi:phage shock protein E